MVKGRQVLSGGRGMQETTPRTEEGDLATKFEGLNKRQAYEVLLRKLKASQLEQSLMLDELALRSILQSWK